MSKKHEIATKIAALVEEAEKAGVLLGFCCENDENHVWCVSNVVSTGSHQGTPMVMITDDRAWSSDEVSWDE